MGETNIVEIILCFFTYTDAAPCTDAASLTDASPSIWICTRTLSSLKGTLALRRLERVFSARARFYCSRQLGIQIAVKDARATSEIEETGNWERAKNIFIYFEN